jgi:hypothetical protein
MQNIKISLRFHLIAVRLCTARKQTTNAGEDGGKKKYLHSIPGNVNKCSLYGNQCGDSSQTKERTTYDLAMPLLSMY